jgi:hypothetical protein
MKLKQGKYQVKRKLLTQSPVKDLSQMMYFLDTISWDIASLTHCFRDCDGTTCDEFHYFKPRHHTVSSCLFFPVLFLHPIKTSFVKMLYPFNSY